MDPILTLIVVASLLGLLVYMISNYNQQSKRYLEIIQRQNGLIANNTDAINRLRETIINLNSTEGMNGRLLEQIYKEVSK